MKKFTKGDENRQFIEINISDASRTIYILETLKDTYPVLNDVLFDITSHAILFEIIEKVRYGFSLNQLRTLIKNFTPIATVKCFTVDLDEPNQRVY